MQADEERLMLQYMMLWLQSYTCSDPERKSGLEDERRVVGDVVVRRQFTSHITRR